MPVFLDNISVAMWFGDIFVPMGGEHSDLRQREKWGAVDGDRVRDSVRDGVQSTEPIPYSETCRRALVERWVFGFHLLT